MFPFSHRTSMPDRQDHSQVIAQHGISVFTKDKFNAIATLTVPEVTLLGADTSD